MSEILLRKREHFAEQVQPKEWSDVKWAGRPLRGDVVEVKPDGFYRVEALGRGLHGWDRDAFALVLIPDLHAANTSYLAKSYTNATESVKATVQYKARYTLPAWARLSWIKTKVTVNKREFEEWYCVVAAIADLGVVDKVA